MERTASKIVLLVDITTFVNNTKKSEYIIVTLRTRAVYELIADQVRTRIIELAISRKNAVLSGYITTLKNKQKLDVLL
jgi:hypothetical protein